MYSVNCIADANESPIWLGQIERIYENWDFFCSRQRLPSESKKAAINEWISRQRGCWLGNALGVGVPYEIRNTYASCGSHHSYCNKKSLARLPPLFSKFLIRKFHVLLIIYVRNISYAHRTLWKREKEKAWKSFAKGFFSCAESWNVWSVLR